MITAELRGVGPRMTKSAELSSVSVVPPCSRRAAVVFDSCAVGDVSAQLAAPNPIRSARSAPLGHAPESRLAVRTSATFPAVALIEIEPTASGVGKGVVPPLPIASCTR